MAMAVTYETFDGVLLSENRGGTVTEYFGDPLGSLVRTEDATGAATSTATYWPYGGLRSSTGSNPSPWGFVGLLGYFTDSVSRLYVRMRHYRPDTTAWMTIDPLWPREVPFTYSRNHPIAFVDPSGLAASECSQFQFDGCTAEESGFICSAFKAFCGSQICKLNDDCGAEELPCGINGHTYLMEALRDLCNNNWKSPTKIRIKCDKGGFLGETCCNAFGDRSCGCSPDKHTIVICPGNWKSIKGCGPLYCTIVHEFIHLCGGGENGPGMRCLDNVKSCRNKQIDKR